MNLYSLVLYCLGLVLLFLAGCTLAAAPTATSVATSVGTSVGTTMGTEAALEQGLTDRHGPKVKHPGEYFDFNDVLIPPGLSLNKERTTIFQAQGAKIGRLVFDGRVTSESLARYFRESMPNDRWEMVGSFDYPAMALFFSKPGKTCVIHIGESSYYTRVAIWVTPHKHSSP